MIKYFKKPETTNRFLTKFEKDRTNKIWFFTKYGSIRWGLPVWIIVILTPKFFNDNFSFSYLVNDLRYNLLITLLYFIVVGFFIGYLVYRYRNKAYNNLKNN